MPTDEYARTSLANNRNLLKRISARNFRKSSGPSIQAKTDISQTALHRAKKRRNVQAGVVYAIFIVALLVIAFLALFVL